MCVFTVLCFALQKSAPPDNDDFASFRHNVIELVRDVIFLLGSLTCFSEVSQPLVYNDVIVM